MFTKNLLIANINGERKIALKISSAKSEITLPPGPAGKPRYRIVEKFVVETIDGVRHEVMGDDVSKPTGNQLTVIRNGYVDRHNYTVTSLVKVGAIRLEPDYSPFTGKFISNRIVMLIPQWWFEVDYS